MPQEGVVEQWDGSRGFGFIRSQGTRVFFHVRDFRATGGSAPSVGTAVRFELIQVGGRGPRAMAVTPLLAAAAPAPHATRSKRQAPPGPARPPARATAPGNATIVLTWGLMAVWLAAWAWGVWSHRLPGWWPVALLNLNLATFVAYWLDKRAAEKNHWRTPESQLHLLALLGGWPAAWWAQQLLRHKSIKPAFRQTYAVTVMAHCGALAAWLTGVAPG